MSKENVNTITPYIQKIYEWASLLTTEQKEESANYFWTPEAKALLRRLECSSGNMIAVLGLQGSGKTALRQALELQLANKDFAVFSLKWVGDIHKKFEEKTLGEEHEAEYFDELMDALYDEELRKAQKSIFDRISLNDITSKIAKRLGLLDHVDHILAYLKARYSRKAYSEGDLEVCRAEILRFLPLIERSLGKAKVNEIKTRFLTDQLQTAHTILIDMPDYDRSNFREMYRDLTKLQTWWENVFTDQFEGYTQKVNLVLFFQKEMFHGHFFMGKFDVYELKPLTPDQLLECYRNLFQSFEPFTEEALRQIAILSRGIFRRFKKYIRICLDNFLNLNTITPNLEDKRVISVEDVNQWITEDQIVKDMELELMTIFPKERENRVLSVKVFSLLREKGALPQSKIAEEIFEGALMKTSRVLDRLESWGYIKRERSGKEKIVSLT
jgi:energy-coupling factor transporter ATP-binding protein EcfA2